MSSITPHIYSETGQLRAVVLGIADSIGEVPTVESCYDPKSKESVRLGIYPEESALIDEMEGVSRILQKHGVTVYRPACLEGVNQIFARDVSFALEDKYIIPEIIPDRQAEIQGLKTVEQAISGESTVRFSQGMRAEGGDCMPWRDHVFVGYTPKEYFADYKTARTNEAAIEELKRLFPHKTIKSIALVKDDDDPRRGILHLDCCFQPIGMDEAIFYPKGMQREEDREYVRTLFGDDKLITINQEEFYHMFPNVFSINEKTIISNTSFTRLNDELRDRGYTVEETPYDEVSKMGGLLRCSTLPLYREAH